MGPRPACYLIIFNTLNITGLDPPHISNMFVTFRSNTERLTAAAFFLMMGSDCCLCCYQHGQQGRAISSPERNVKSLELDWSDRGDPIPSPGPDENTNGSLVSSYYSTPSLGSVYHHGLIAWQSQWGGDHPNNETNLTAWGTGTLPGLSSQ